MPMPLTETSFPSPTRGRAEPARRVTPYRNYISFDDRDAAACIASFRKKYCSPKRAVPAFPEAAAAEGAIRAFVVVDSRNGRIRAEFLPSDGRNLRHRPVDGTHWIEVNPDIRCDRLFDMIGTAKHLIKILVNYTSFRYDEKAYRESETLVLKPHAKHEAKDASMALRKVFGSDYVHRLVA